MYPTRKCVREEDGTREIGVKIQFFSFHIQTQFSVLLGWSESTWKYVCLHLNNNSLISCCTEKTLMFSYRKLTGKERKPTAKYTS